MFRLILTILAVVVFATSAWAFPDQWDGEGSGVITVSIDIGCWIQTYFQDDDIVFDLVETPTDTQDFYYDGANVDGGAYTPISDLNTPPYDKTPSDPWAGNTGDFGADGCYYESYDGARWYIRSNNPLTMTVTTNGDLYGVETGCPGNYIPTWFTLCAAPFQESGEWSGFASPPYTSAWGSYFGDDGSGAFTWGNNTSHGPEHVWPTQHCFPCGPDDASNSWTASFCPGLEGTLQWLGRIQRMGFDDCGADYSTTIDVGFTSPGMTPPGP